MKKTLEDIKKVFESKGSFRLLCAIGVVIAAVLIFSLGVTVGFHKASFGRAWEEHYGENFGFDMPTRRSFGVGGMDYFPNAHGATGKIITVELPHIIVEGKDNTEKVILLGNDTKIEEAGTDVQPADLKIDDFVVVIGTPDDQGVIEAKFIRLMPNPELLK